MITIYHTDGKVETFPHTGDPGLKKLQGWVGGYIELVTLKDGSQLFCNEEGKIHGLPANEKATKDLWEPNFGPTDILVGPIVHLTGDSMAT